MEEEAESQLKAQELESDYHCSSGLQDDVFVEDWTPQVTPHDNYAASSIITLYW